MKTHPKVPGASPTLESRRGVALITVLTIISLCTILVLTFFQLAQNEMIASDSYNSGLEAQQVAEQAVNLVIKQIREATSNMDSGWASQPGAIRTWDSFGEFKKAYKLYSDEEMSSENEAELVENDFMDLAHWDRSPNQYVDLNEPVIRGSQIFYPIVDPSAAKVPAWRQQMGDDRDGIEGFLLSALDRAQPILQHLPNVDVSEGPMGNAVAGVRSADGVRRSPLPMPVKWIYQLKDGSLGVLDNAGSFKPTAGGNPASASNPIVARFAFWADDETSKLNPNTHAGGATWTTPMASGMVDRNLGRYQPTKNEWQRYPGHPATTHLAPLVAPGIPDITLNRDNMEMIFALVPRVVGGGSVSGTKKVDFRDPAEKNGLIADKDRLYATMDEFFLEPGYRSNAPNNSNKLRDFNKFPDPSGGGRGGNEIDWEVMRDNAERMKFFVSVVSRSPETTMFNTPRVSIWPTHWSGSTLKGSVPTLTAFDRMIRFCGEVGRGVTGQHIYHFQRHNEDSATADLVDIDRNRDLLLYLDAMMGTPVPGFGNSFKSKYGENEARQILTQIFDYIRSSNLHDDTLFGEDWNRAFTGPNQNSSNHSTYTNGRISDANSRHIHKGHGQVTPIRISNKIPGMSSWQEETKGLGRFYTLSEMAVVIINCADGGLFGGGPSNRFLGSARLSNPGMTKYGVNGYFEQPSPKYAYSNIPPYPSAALLSQLNNQTGLDNEPLRPVAENPANWNWQLAWLDPAYESAQPAGKFRAGVNSDLCYLAANEQCLQAMLVWSMFSPSLGWVPINPDMILDIEITGMEFQDSRGAPVRFGQHSGQQSASRNLSLPISSSSIGENAWIPNDIQGVWHDRHYGGLKAMTYFLTGKSGANVGIRFTPPPTGWANLGASGRFSPIDYGFESVEGYNRYHYVTKPFRNDRETVKMSEGMVKLNIWSTGKANQKDSLNSAPREDSSVLVQEIDIPFPEFEARVPLLADGRAGYINEFNQEERSRTHPMFYWSLSRDGANPSTASRGRLSMVNSDNGGLFDSGDIVKAVGVRHGDARVVAAQAQVFSGQSGGRGTLTKDGQGVFFPHKEYKNKEMRSAHGFMYTTGARYSGSDRDDRSRWLVRFANNEPARKVYHPGRVPKLMYSDESKFVQRYGDFDSGFGNAIDGPYINKPDEGNTHSLFNRTDPNALILGNFEMARDYGDFPYFVRDWIHESGTPSYFSPNRILSSPGQFGSLPVGSTRKFSYSAAGSEPATYRGEPWRTLLFRPNVVTSGSGIPQDKPTYASHPGAGTSEEVPDHLLMDLFWMPVVEPYAISEPLSTGGKVNLNYQILPFRHIHRSTALRGVFKSEYMLAIPNEWVPDAKVGVGRGQRYHWRDNPYGGTLESKSLRAVILEDRTLEQFEERFNIDKTIFKSASEICEIHLVPQEIADRTGMGGSAAKINSPVPKVKEMKDGSYWERHATVGENARERNYSNIYARVTTKSNTFKVHYRAQVLRKAGEKSGADPTKWDPIVDQVVAEYRGSSIVERYVDPNDSDIPDYATGELSVREPLDQYYRYRIVHPTRFAP